MQNIYFWENFLMENKNFKFKENSYIVKFSLENLQQGDIFKEWFSFPSKDGILGFLEYIALPSIYTSILLARDIFFEEGIVLDALDREEVLELFDSYEGLDLDDLSESYLKDLEELEYLRENFSLARLRNLFEKLMDLSNFEIIIELLVYDNLLDLGEDLIDSYSKIDSIETLEEGLSVDREEILDLFKEGRKNIFVWERISKFLNNYLD